jgi:hypothetical protein
VQDSTEKALQDLLHPKIFDGTTSSAVGGAVNDLSSLVKKKKKPSTTETEGEKRKAEAEIEDEGSAKKAKVDS